MKNLKNIKKIFAVAMVCAATFVGYNTYKQATMTEQERLIQANLEALSGVELSSGDPCYSSVTYASKMPKVADCNKGDCKYTNGTHDSTIDVCQ